MGDTTGPCTCGSADDRHPLDCLVWNHASQAERKAAYFAELERQAVENWNTVDVLGPKRSLR